MRLFSCLSLFLLAIGLSACNQAPEEPAREGEASEATTPAPAPAPAEAKADSDRLVLELKQGKVVIKLRPDLAPQHVKRVKQLVGEGFYDGLKFHRVIGGFMAQTGDPLGTGEGGSKYPDLPAEFSKTPFERGVIGAARTRDPNSANSQFFITLAAAPHLNGQYTVWGEVVEGMELVDQIAKGEPPASPDTIVRMHTE